MGRVTRLKRNRHGFVTGRGRFTADASRRTIQRGRFAADASRRTIHGGRSTTDVPLWLLGVPGMDRPVMREMRPQRQAGRGCLLVLPDQHEGRPVKGVGAKLADFLHGVLGGEGFIGIALELLVEDLHEIGGALIVHVP